MDEIRCNYLIFGQVLEKIGKKADAFRAYRCFIQTNTFYATYVGAKGESFVTAELSRLDSLERFLVYENFLNKLRRFADRYGTSELNGINFATRTKLKGV